jgi:hypothetical protein
MHRAMATNASKVMPVNCNENFFVFIFADESFEVSLVSRVYISSYIINSHILLFRVNLN